MLKEKRILYFEGAGWEGADSSRATDLGNCRIRTRIKNKDGRIIYLEMGGFLRNKYTPKDVDFSILGRIDHVFYTDIDWDARDNYSRELSQYEKLSFEYNKENVLNFVNEKLNCDFEDIVTLSELNVHGTKEPLSDCSKADVEPYKDMPILSDTLQYSKVKREYHEGLIDYWVDWDIIKNLDCIKNNMRDDINKDSFYLKVRQYKGEITGMELTSTDSSFPHFFLGKETARELINKI